MAARAPCVLLWSGARRGGCAQRADGSWEPWVVSGDGLCGQPRPALSQRLSLETVASSWAGVRARDRWQEAHCRDQSADLSRAGIGPPPRPDHRRTPSLPWVPGPLEVGGSVTGTPALNAPRLHLPHAPSPTRWALGKAPATTVASGGVQHPQPSVPASTLTFTRCPNADATFRPYENGVHVSHHLNFVFPRESM